MTARDWPWIIGGAVLGLLVCSVIDAIAIERLRADVDFLTSVSEQNLLRSSKHGA